jgi:sensor c-di-GMP phosphodiesterase-like protein
MWGLRIGWSLGGAAFLIKLADGLGMNVTAEGVETYAQLEWLRSAGCTEAQGYLISRPLNTANLRSFVSDGRRCRLISRNWCCFHKLPKTA